MRRRKKRSVWVKDWIKRRAQLGAYNQLLSELKNEDPECYKNFLRMKHDDFQYLCNKISPAIKKQDTNMRLAISVEERLAITLRFLASGDSYRSLSYLFRVPQQTISKIIPECCDAIHRFLKPNYMEVPSSEDCWKKKSEDFKNKWNFPNAIGALDGKHVVIKAPQHSGSLYYNYKGTFSIVLMALVDANYKFIYVDVGCNGRISDGGVFANCSLSNALSNGSLNIPPPMPLPGRAKYVPYVIIADDAFPLKPYLMKPFPFRNQPGPNRVYNYRLSRARRVVENAFGLLANRFRILRKPIELCPEKVIKLVTAICVLHNFLLERSSRHVYAPQGSFDEEIDGVVTPGSWRQDPPPDNILFSNRPLASNMSNESKEIREEYKEYFVSPEGEVSWQYTYIS
ncbi:uncharacterized protein LOC118264220 [Spodoptera frugiperda]|uniref:Uncharacterized protein LOC118264220 n=1 Tax=Spodoptera frugiperda TaxID=7108 RepID=A0A9R0EGG0_SPOFR|nr:uncharacterized protein LOC118264220 [Spodoptera frugiperda]